MASNGRTRTAEWLARLDERVAHLQESVEDLALTWRVAGEKLEARLRQVENQLLADRGLGRVFRIIGLLAAAVIIAVISVLGTLRITNTP